MIANEHFRQHPAIPIWDFGRVKGLPSRRGRTPSITGWNCPRIDPEAGNGTAETQERSTTDMRYLLLSGVAIIAALAITTPASAQRSGPGPGAQTGTGPGVYPPGGFGPSSSALYNAQDVYPNPSAPGAVPWETIWPTTTPLAGTMPSAVLPQSR
jgi:hypothetical protein